MAFARKGKGAFKYVQLEAAFGLIRTLFNSLGIGLAEGRSSQSYEEGSPIDEAERLEKLQEGLKTDEGSKWVPQIEAVLLEYLCHPSLFSPADAAADISFPRNDFIKGATRDQLNSACKTFLELTGVFSPLDSLIDSLCKVFVDDSDGLSDADPQDLLSLAQTLLQFTFPPPDSSGWIGGGPKQDENYDRFNWGPIEKRVLWAIVE